MGRVAQAKEVNESRTKIISLLTVLITVATAVGCQSIPERRDVRPLVMRDVPANRLAYRFEADTGPPADLSIDEVPEKIEAVQADFTTRRPDDALLRTVLSPDSQRVLALYGTDAEPSSAFRIDLYAADGKFLRNLTPASLSCVFPETVGWSTDGSFITFIAHRAPTPSPTPTPRVSDTEIFPEPSASPSVAPAFPLVPMFSTEQIYVCNRDGYDLKPLTTREGLIYFYSAWAPDSRALVALACKEAEWEAREREFKMPAGRPRLITLDGKERLLDDRLTEALPVWSSDASKIATAFDTNVAIYDAAGPNPTHARMDLREALIRASVIYEQKQRGKNREGADLSTSALPASFNPVTRVYWPTPDRLYLQTAYVRLIPNEPIITFQRWHLLTLSAQAAILK